MYVFFYLFIEHSPLPLVILHALYK